MVTWDCTSALTEVASNILEMPVGASSVRADILPAIPVMAASVVLFALPVLEPRPMLLSGWVTSPAPVIPAEMAMLLAWKRAVLSTFVRLVVPVVVKLLLLMSTAFCELVIAPP